MPNYPFVMIELSQLAKISPNITNDLFSNIMRSQTNVDWKV